MYYQYLKEALENLLTSAPLKALAASALALLMNKQLMLFYGFIVLVFLDCFTRWLAISYKYLKEIQEITEPSLWQCFCGLAKTRKAGLISSTVMRERGLSKLIVYVICVTTAALNDKMLSAIGSQDWMVSLMVGYLIVTEALSVVENLSDAGVGNMSELVKKIKCKI